MNTTEPVIGLVDRIDQAAGTTPAPADLGLGSCVVCGKAGCTDPHTKTDAMTALGMVLTGGLDDACTTGCQRKADAANGERPQPKPLYSGVVQYPPPFEWQEAIGKCRTNDPSLSVAWQRIYERASDLDSLDFLLEYRRLLAQRLAPLSAMHRHAGKWDELRKALRAQIKSEIRRNPKLFSLGPNPSNDAVEDMAGSDERYVAALRIAFREAREYEELADELARLEHRIEARKVANMQAIKEMGLQ